MTKGELINLLTKGALKDMPMDMDVLIRKDELSYSYSLLETATLEEVLFYSEDEPELNCTENAIVLAD